MTKPKGSNVMNLIGRIGAAAAFALSMTTAANAATNIEFMFPAAVQGNLSSEMQHIVDEFNNTHADIHVSAVFSGSYGETLTKSMSAARVGRPPAVALESANFIPNLAINGFIENLGPYISMDGSQPEVYMQAFWPALRPNAMLNGIVYALPFQNSTPVLYYNKSLFKTAGLDPEKPPKNWSEWIADAKRLTNKQAGHWGVIIPTSNGSYLMWLLQSLAMANGGQVYNTAYPGEVYLNQPSVVDAIRFWKNLSDKYEVMPKGVTAAGAGTAEFLAGKVGMIVLSTGSLGYIRSHAKFPLGVAFVPGHVRNAVPIGGGSLVMFKGLSPATRKAAWTFMQWMQEPTQLGRWSRFTGYFAPREAVYGTPEMKQYLAQNATAKVALEQLKYAHAWFAPYNVLEIRQAVVNNVQAVMTGQMSVEDAALKSQQAAEKILALAP